MTPPKRRKLRRTAFIPLHAIPAPAWRAAQARACSDASRVLRDERVVLIVLDTLLALHWREGRP